jgi:MFS family permease
MKGHVNVYGVFALILPLYFLSMFCRVSPSVLSSSMAASFAVDTTAIAALSSITFMACGLMHLPSGIMSDIFGAKKTLCFITFVSALGNILFAFSGSMASATAARFIIGIGCATAVPSSALLATSLPKHLFGKLSGLLLSAGPLAMFMAGRPLIALDSLLGWKTLMLICGCCGLAMAVLCLLFLPGGTGARKSLRQAAREVALGLRLIATYRNFWALTLWFTILVGLYFSITGMWWAPFLINGCGLTKEEAGTIMSIAPLTFPLFVILPVLSDRFRSRKKIFLAVNALTLVLLLLYPLCAQDMSFTMLLIHGILLIASIGMYGGVAFASMNEIVPLSVVGTALGCLQIFPLLIATPVIQHGFGALLDHHLAAGADAGTAYVDASWLFVAVSAAAFMILLFYRDTYAGDKK